MVDKQTSEPSSLIERVKAEVGKVVVGQKKMIDLMIQVLLCRGHILIEGVPGLAKSLAVETFARVIGGEFRRFQFTPDKMPSDITGSSIYNQKENKFDYYFGPIFCNVFLADEINRASPKVQSALLSAMQERMVDVECVRYDIPEPFMVLATQNPIEQVGTYPLAEAQVDRFMVKYNIRYPEREQEARLMAWKNTDFEQRKRMVRQVATTEEILDMRRRIHEGVHVEKSVMNYMLDICTATRPPETREGNRPGIDPGIYRYIRLGASPRASEFLLALSKTAAFCRGKHHVDFQDVNACAADVLRHRILLSSRAVAEKVSSDHLVEKILAMVRPY